LAANQAFVQEYCKQKHAGKEKTVQVMWQNPNHQMGGLQELKESTT
jgi:hypothetical protein